MLVEKLGGPVSFNQDWQLGKIGITPMNYQVLSLLLGEAAKRM